MTGRIPQSFIDDVLARTDLVELIDSRVPLKKAGHNHKACCPFHQEKTPSFSVNGNKQFYHCFGCGASGNAISFLMEYDRLDFPDAVEELAARLGLEVPRDANAGPSISKSLYDLMQQAADYYAGQLGKHAEAREYLGQRQLSSEVVKQFRIGYAPDAWSGLLDNYPRDNDTIKQLIEVGMVVKNDRGKTYDRFRGRLMFPIRDKRGKVIAFGGRIIGDGQPKYLNSPETPIFSKGRELYGLYEARQANRQLDQLLVVEGYMDVVALAQFGINYAVATLGTATTEFHLKELFKNTNTVVFCFDGDKAGRDAAWKALDIALPQVRGDRIVRFMFLPQGEDPDTMVRAQGQDGFEVALADAQSLSDYLLSSLATGLDLSNADTRSGFIGRLIPYLDKITYDIYRDMLIEQAAGMLNISTDQLASRLAGKEPTPSRKPVSPKNQIKTITPMRVLIASLVQNPQLATEVTNTGWLDQVEQPGAPLLKSILDLLHASPHLNTGSLLEHWRDKPEFKQLQTLASWELMMETDETHQEVFRDAIAKLFSELRHKRREALIHRQKQGSLSTEEMKELRQLLSTNS